MPAGTNINSVHYAANGVDTYQGPQEFVIGDTPAVSTQDFLIPAALDAVAQYTPLSQGGVGGELKLWAAGEELAAIAAYGLTGSTRAALYFAGMFNQDMIVWPGGTTEAQIEAAQKGMVRCRKPLYSDKRTGNEVVGTQAGGA